MHDALAAVETLASVPARVPICLKHALAGRVAHWNQKASSARASTHKDVAGAFHTNRYDSFDAAHHHQNCQPHDSSSTVQYIQFHSSDSSLK